MADLIIKPTSGGALKLQEDGGTDAISIATSGVATIANAAITDGTITAATFPSGHVIQTVYNQQTSSGNDQAADGNTHTSTVRSQAITTKKANSKIYTYSVCHGSHSQNGTYGQEWFQRAITGGATTQLEFGTNNGIVRGFYNRASGDTNNYEPLACVYLDAPAQAAGTTITYSVRFKRSSGSNTFYSVHSGYGVLTIVQEIAA